MSKKGQIQLTDHHDTDHQGDDRTEENDLMGGDVLQELYAKVHHRIGEARKEDVYDAFLLQAAKLSFQLGLS